MASADPIDYQTPLPDGRNLRVVETADAVRVSRDRVPLIAVWGEAAVPAFIVGAAAIGAVVWWRLTLWWGVRLEIRAVLLTAWGLAVAALCLAMWHNVGVVTEVAIAGDAVYWRKRNVWGESERFWPLAAVAGVHAGRVDRSLRVRRHRGMPLIAFAYQDPDDLTAAAAALDRAAARGRAAARETAA